ncbi:MAG: radical SAM/SPASM domain-containing protein [Methanosarcinaceae archaeon]
MTGFSPVLTAQALWQLRVKKRPFVMSHAINSKCNMRCKFCEYWKADGDEMSLKEIISMLDDARSFGILYYNAWTAEPLLREDLPDILEHAHKIGMITSIITNGKLLEKRADELKDLDYLSVSVDGIESYREIRGIDFDEILPGIKKAKEGRKNPLLMNCVIGGKNLDDIEPLIHLAKELDVRISFEPIYEFGGIDKDVWNELGIKDMKKYQDTVQRIIEMKTQGYPIINSITYLTMVRDRTTDFKCHASDIVLNVTADGTVENCRVKKAALGNVKNGIENIWNLSKEIRKSISTQCEGCLFFGYVENSLLYDFNIEVIRHYDWV